MRGHFGIEMALGRDKLLPEFVDGKITRGQEIDPHVKVKELITVEGSDWNLQSIRSVLLNEESY